MTTPQRTGEQMAERRDDGGEDGNGGTGAGIATKTRAKTKQPTPYRVLMLNDDYTPMEFVVLCLQRFFRMDMEAATRVMLHVHQKGVGVCGRPLALAPRHAIFWQHGVDPRNEAGRNDGRAPRRWWRGWQ